MPPKRKRKSKADAAEEEIFVRKEHDIPYFAHQVLDPAKFPDSIGMAVGGPSPGATNNHSNEMHDAWDDDDSEGQDLAGESSDEHSPKKASRGKKRPADSSPNQADGTSFKRVKVTGGRPPTAKKITADFDSDDEIIFNMKNAKYLEKDIAQRLVDENRVQYNPKTIGTRWARLKKARQDRQDELLDANLTDWHDGDDDVLYQAVAKANASIEKAKKQVDDRKWRIVADHLKQVKPVTDFSQNACQKRHEALQRGNAKPTPESITNPDETVLARIKSRKDKEAKLQADMSLNHNLASSAQEKENLRDNAWTSKRKPF